MGNATQCWESHAPHLPSQKTLWQLRVLAGAGQFPAQNFAVLLSTPHFPLEQMVFPPLSDKTTGKLPLWKATRARGSTSYGFHTCYALEGVEL